MQIQENRCGHVHFIQPTPAVQLPDVRSQLQFCGDRMKKLQQDLGQPLKAGFNLVISH